MSLLTIKHVEKDGHQSVRMAHSVSYIAPTLEAYGCIGDGGPVSKGWCCYGSGKVYIMNDAGSTVDIYDLG